MTTIIIFILVIGVVSTLVLDIWAQLQQKLAGVPAPDWGVAGRWVKGLTHGQWVLDADAGQGPSSHDKTVGWLFHYGVGIVYAALLFVIGGSVFAVQPTLGPPIAVGLVLATLAGLFIFLPGLGAGVAGSKLPDQKAAIMHMLVGHLIFALAQYLTALTLSALL
ncbi:DUF2938 family protein [Salinisphaera sp. SPP-AMP-43]|uniref:DUF2938 family protein n=1 Tax=Salinisphaera sp. SPP-AMP-43 TaxID=3121288 RepID=UPI003C6E8E32